MERKDYYTVPELADILGLSRIAIFKRVRQGKIKAIKIGRIYAIPKQEIEHILGQTLTAEEKRIIDEGVSKTIKEYGRTLELLGQE